MKTYLKTAMVMVLVALVVTACNTVEMPKVPVPAGTPVAAATNFTVHYGVPLTTGRLSGENAIMDPNNASNTNVAELKPAIAKVVEDALGGKVASYPDNASSSTEDPMTYLQTVVAEWAADGGPKVSVNELTVSLDVTYDGVAADGHSRLTPKFMDIVWVDPKDEMPDRVICRMHMKDLGGYMVQSGGKAVGLAAYLQGRRFENYPMVLEGPKETVRIGAFTEAASLQARIDAGTL